MGKIVGKQIVTRCIGGILDRVQRAVRVIGIVELHVPALLEQQQVSEVYIFVIHTVDGLAYAHTRVVIAVAYGVAVVLQGRKLAPVLPNDILFLMPIVYFML